MVHFWPVLCTRLPRAWKALCSINRQHQHEPTKHKTPIFISKSALLTDSWPILGKQLHSLPPSEYATGLLTVSVTITCSIFSSCIFCIELLWGNNSLINEQQQKSASHQKYHQIRFSKHYFVVNGWNNPFFLNTIIIICRFLLIFRIHPKDLIHPFTTLQKPHLVNNNSMELTNTLIIITRSINVILSKMVWFFSPRVV